MYPTFQPTKRPDYTPDWSQDPEGMAAIDGKSPFIMMSDGKSSLFVPSGSRTARCRPTTSRWNRRCATRSTSSRTTRRPRKWPRLDNPYHNSPIPRYPYAITTYRLTEHHSGAIPTRMVPILAELQPEGFAEIPPELAAEKGIANLDWIVISTARGAVETGLITDGCGRSI
jgi:formate dehydrogenase major subunit